MHLMLTTELSPDKEGKYERWWCLCVYVWGGGGVSHYHYPLCSLKRQAHNQIAGWCGDLGCGVVLFWYGFTDFSFN